MPRPPNPKSKTLQIVIQCLRPEWEPEFRGFKEVCARDGINMSQEGYERLVRPFLQEHHWPPGNPQTQLFKTPTLRSSCSFVDCGHEAGWIGEYKGVKHRVCSFHKRRVGRVRSWGGWREL